MLKNKTKPKELNYLDLCVTITKKLKEKCQNALNNNVIPLDVKVKPCTFCDFTEIETNHNGNYASVHFNVWLRPYEIPYIKIGVKAYCDCVYNVKDKFFDPIITLYDIGDESCSTLFTDYCNDTKALDMNRFVDYKYYSNVSNS